MEFECSICGGPPGYSWSKTAAGNIICEECFRKTGLRHVGMMEKMSLEEIVERMEKYRSESPADYHDSTSAINKLAPRSTEYMYINKKDRIVAIQSTDNSGLFSKKQKIYSYTFSQLRTFRVEENGNVLMAGDSEGTLEENKEGQKKMAGEKYCYSVKVIITADHPEEPQAEINLIERRYKRGCSIHREALDNALQIMKELSLMCEVARDDDRMMTEEDE